MDQLFPVWSGDADCLAFVCTFPSLVFLFIRGRFLHCLLGGFPDSLADLPADSFWRAFLLFESAGLCSTSSFATGDLALAVMV